MDQLKNIVLGAFLGFRDSLSGIAAVRYLNESESSGGTSEEHHKGISRRKSQNNALKRICFDVVLMPCLFYVMGLLFGSSPNLLSTVWSWLRPLLSYTFGALWILPLFLLSRIVNALWFQDIADSAYKGRSQSLKTLSKLIADTFFSLVIQALFILQSLLVGLLPVTILGQSFRLFHLSLLYSLYSFEYKWFNMGWELHRRLHFIENNWPYFFGFGLPLAILTSLSDSYIISGCIFSIVFPFFIISGNEAKPQRGLCDFPLQLFQPVVWLSNKIFHGTMFMTGSSQGRTILNKLKNR